MPRGVITERYAGVLLCGDVIQSGYIPEDEQTKAGEKYYVQTTAPGMTSNAVRMSETAWNQFLDSGADMGTPCVMEVRSSVFNGAQYYTADSFHVRSPGRPAFVPKDAKPADAVAKMEQAVKAGAKP